MVRDEIRDSDGLQRRAVVQEHHRTDARDETSEWIEENIVDGEIDWADTTMTEIGEAVGRSREHVSQVLDRYFHPAGVARHSLHDGGVERTGDGATDAYRRGFLDGLKHALDALDDKTAEEISVRDLLE